MIRYVLIVLLTLFFSTLAHGNSARLSFSESSAELGFSTGGDYKDTVDFGFSGYYNEDNDVFLTLDMLTSLQGDSSSPWLFSLGAKAFGLLLKQKVTEQSEEKNRGFIGITVALQVGYQFLTSIPIAIITDFSYSPDILNTGKIENVRQIGATLEIMLSPSAIAQFGYRHYRATFESNVLHLGENYKNFEDNVFAGIKLRF